MGPLDLPIPLLFVLWWVVAAFLLKNIAKRRGNSSGRFFLIGIILGPILGALFLIAMPRGDNW